MMQYYQLWSISEDARKYEIVTIPKMHSTIF